MPKEITHWTLAEKVYLNINSNSSLKEIIKQYKNLYLTGAVIIDTPFYIIFDKKAKMIYKLAEDMHNNPINSYEPLAQIINCYHSRLPDEILALILGIITHIHADSSFHPLVYYFSGTGLPDQKKSRRKANTRHRIIETFLDLYYREESLLQNNREFAGILKNIEMEKEQFLENLFVFFNTGNNIDKQLIKKILKCHTNIQRLFDRNWFRIIFQILNVIPGINLEYYISLLYPHPKPEPGSIFQHQINYRHPVTGEEFQDSLKELEERTIKDILEVFKKIEYHWNKNSLAEVFSHLKGTNLYTGMSGKRQSDMHYFDTEKNLMALIFN